MFKNIEKVFFLGPIGTNAQLATKSFIEKFGLDVEIEPVCSITKMLLELNKNKNACAVSPIENSIEGIVRETVDNMLNLDDEIKIISQIVIPINNCLISYGQMEDIKFITSHPQALSQCRGFIVKNFKNDVSLLSVNSTSFAVSDLKNKDKSYCAIGNDFCANLYGIPILKSNISDNKDNQTRFALVGRVSNDELQKNRTSIVFSTKNEPGALLEVLKVFAQYNLNLVYLESRPNKITVGEYNFFVDIDKGIDDIREPLLKIKNYCQFFRLLGSYSVL